jgi:hypothetical protein
LALHIANHAPLTVKHATIHNALTASQVPISVIMVAKCALNLVLHAQNRQQTAHPASLAIPSNPIILVAALTIAVVTKTAPFALRMVFTSANHAISAMPYRIQTAFLANKVALLAVQK